jgi:hypothetical protein
LNVISVSFLPTSSDPGEERRTQAPPRLHRARDVASGSLVHRPTDLSSPFKQVIDVSDDDDSSSDGLEAQHPELPPAGLPPPPNAPTGNSYSNPFGNHSWVDCCTGADGSSQVALALRRPSLQPVCSESSLPKIFPTPTFVDLIINSPAGQHRIITEKDTQPQRYYTILKGQRPGVYYGWYVSRSSSFIHSAAHPGPIFVGKQQVLEAVCQVDKFGALQSLRSRRTKCSSPCTCEVK